MWEICEPDRLEEITKETTEEIEEPKKLSKKILTKRKVKRQEIVEKIIDVPSVIDQERQQQQAQITEGEIILEELIEVSPLDIGKDEIKPEEKITETISDKKTDEDEMEKQKDSEEFRKKKTLKKSKPKEIVSKPKSEPKELVPEKMMIEDKPEKLKKLATLKQETEDQKIEKQLQLPSIDNEKMEKFPEEMMKVTIDELPIADQTVKMIVEQQIPVDDNIIEISFKEQEKVEPKFDRKIESPDKKSTK
ncbi:hypothetical protein DERP_012406 [Dermatophagoides pteronyssinus]|uniref:Titin-like n=1 Tax=Dermatophagoides pteronyssinus TaxID=6956 RepID=A0ABQ8IUM8_DERPT|nr:hypothetical protein DERP_012406 [Dermatophagoides pteronyssinus]